MRKAIIPIERGATPCETHQSLTGAMEAAYKSLASFKSQQDSIDIILSHDDGSHNYAVLASLTAKPVGEAYDREISIWQNDKALKSLGLEQVALNKKVIIDKILDKAFNEVGNLYGLTNLKCERNRLHATYNWLAQMIEANFELKENYGRI